MGEMLGGSVWRWADVVTFERVLIAAHHPPTPTEPFLQHSLCLECPLSSSWVPASLFAKPTTQNTVGDTEVDLISECNKNTVIASA